ncbi:MAG: hypothetical protein J5685_10215 [Clostridiales bacterium]|nr:hypothetical protein [Clostridiales bacterium]
MDKKELVCGSCGGPLIIDYGKQTLVCKFCGVTCDYRYYAEDDIIAIADRFLAEGQSKSARDAYMFLLGKEPHSEHALTKVMLIDHHLKDVSDLLEPDVMKRINGDPGSDAWILEQAEGDSIGRLKNIHDLITYTLRAAGTDSRLKETGSKIKEIEDRIREVQFSLDPGSISEKTGEVLSSDTVRKQIRKRYTLFLILILAISILGSVPLFLMKGGIGFGIFIFAAILLPSGISTLIRFKRETDKVSLEESKVKRWTELDTDLSSLREEQAGLQAEYEEVRRKIEECRGKVMS